MSLNLDKNKDSLLSAWKDVVDDKSSTNWALFGYDGQTNDLKVVGKGDGGIDEMREDLSDGKIMYAFCKVLDPKTSLNKFVLVNWQGEGAPHHRKATSANHIRDVCNLLKGTHITLNARNEEEIDSDIVTEKLSKANSAYCFKERGGDTGRPTGPVGTTYKRVIPQQEINSNERDKFWQKEEEEEKERQEAERKRREEDRNKLDREIKQREIEEAAKREAKIKERSKSISVIREAERNELIRVNAANIIEKDNDLEDRQKEEMERKDRSEILRRQRSQEAQALISKRTFDARAVFEKNTSAGQLRQRRASYQPSSNTSVVSPVKEIVSPIAETVRFSPPSTSPSPSPTSTPTPAPTEEARPAPEPQPLPHTQATAEKEQKLATEEPTLLIKSDALPQNNGFSYSNGYMNGNDESAAQNSTERAQPYSDLLEGDDEVMEGLRAQALYDYQAADDTEISFEPGDIICQIDQIDAGWWHGRGPDGTYGLFPANYVQLLD